MNRQRIHPVSGAVQFPREYICVKCGMGKVYWLTKLAYDRLRTAQHPCAVCSGVLVRGRSRAGKLAKRRARGHLG